MLEFCEFLVLHSWFSNMRPKILQPIRKGTSRTTLYRKLKRRLINAGCFRCPTLECAHRGPVQLESEDPHSRSYCNNDFVVAMPILIPSTFNEVGGQEILPSPNLSPILVPHTPDVEVSGATSISLLVAECSSFMRTSCDRSFSRYSSFNSYYSMRSYSLFIPSFVGYQRDKKRRGKPDITQILRGLAVKLKLSLWGLSQMMNDFRCYFPSIPHDPRTIMRTPRHCRLRNIAGGAYVHIGQRSRLVSLIQERSDPVSSPVNIQLNVDGIQLFSSSCTNVWPILCRITTPFLTSPFVVGLFCGKGKPLCVNEYLADLVTELKDIIPHGVDIPCANSVISTTINVSCFICDSPARAFIKQTKGHTGYYGCDFCICEGLHCGSNMAYPDLCAPLRTDAMFRSRSQSGHHIGDSPLEELSISMVDQFPPDYMHAVCLGLVRRFVKLLRIVPVGHHARLSLVNWKRLHDKIVGYQSCFTYEFPRK